MVKDWTHTAVYYTYDGRGLISRVHSPAGWTYYTFDARGAVTRRELPNGTHTYYAYDAAGRTSSIHDEQSDGTAICSFAFTRDDNGNILTSLREDDSCWYYAYDGLQRLTEAEWKDSTGVSLYAFEYDYDKVGNRTHLLFNGTHTYYTYNEANELTVEEELGGDTVYYTYDGRGNQTERTVLGGETLYFDYNSRNLITRIDSTEGGFTPNTFDYNALGQRISKADSTGLTYYVWDGLNITHEHDGSGTVTRRYTHGHTPIHGVFSLIDVEDDANNHYFYHLDQVGGVHRLTDASETTDTTYEFSPFGRVLEETAGSAPTDFTFPATYVRLPDVPGSRLSLSRTYDSETGAYHSRDTMAWTPSYGALSRDPIQVVDPAGHVPLSFSAGLMRAAGPYGPPPERDTGCFYKCGVESFSVRWTAFPEHGGSCAGFSITTVIRFRDDAQHAPACCEFEQWVRTLSTRRVMIKRAGEQRPHAEVRRRQTQWHDDGYGRGLPWDRDMKPWVHDPGFVTVDYPGWTTPSMGIQPEDDLDFLFTAAQYVRGAQADYEFSAGRWCAKQGFIQRVGPHTGTIKGTYRKRKGKDGRTFGGVPWAGKGAAFTGGPRTDAPVPKQTIFEGGKRIQR